MPQQTDLEPKRLPLVVLPENRDTTTNKDARLVNAYVEKDEYGNYHIRKRPGLSLVTTLTGGTGRGLFQWRSNEYAVSGTTLYKNGSSLGTVDATNGVYRFNACLGATPRLFLGNGVKAYNYDSSGGLVVVVDADFPTSFVKGSAYIDGTMYVMDGNANIQGSGLNDTVNWDPLNKIVAQIEPDTGVALAKQLVYVIALKATTTEAFYDAGNATASPLGTVQGAFVQYGCGHQDSVQYLDSKLLWLGTTRNGSLNVMLMDQLKAQPVSTKPIERLIENADLTQGVLSWAMKARGHGFYGLTIKDSSINATLVFDAAEGMWAQWTDSAGNYFKGLATCPASLQKTHIQLEDGNIYLLSEENLYDYNNSAIRVDIITPLFDNGNKWTKVMQRLDFVADQVPGTMYVRWSDDDYQTWTDFVPVDMSQERPSIQDGSSFIRRAYHFRYSGNTKFRLQAVEYQLEQGTA